MKRSVASTNKTIEVARDIYQSPAYRGAPENPLVDNHWRAFQHLAQHALGIARDYEKLEQQLFRYHTLAGRLIVADETERQELIHELIATWEGIAIHD